MLAIAERFTAMIRQGVVAKTLQLILLLTAVALLSPLAAAQSLGSAGTVTGVVTDPNNAVLPNATVKIENPVTGYTRTTTTGEDGSFRFNDVPQQNYQITVTVNGFAPEQQAVSVQTSVPINLKITLAVGEINSEQVTVTETINMLENVPTTHTYVDQSLINKLPIRSPGSGFSHVVTHAAPGVVAD